MAKTDAPDLSALLGVSVTMEDVTSENAGQIKSSRGRQEGQDIVALRDVLRDSLKSGKAKVFTGITEDNVRDTLVRKVRQAGKGAGPDNSDVKVTTSYDRASGRLFWGPKEVIDRLTGKTPANAS
jgi:hypothetical protein